MRAKEIITETTKGGMIPGLETTGGTTLGKNELSGQFDKYKTGSENPFKKPYKQPSKPTNLPPGVTVKEELNPNLGKILELANKFAIAIANMKIYTDDIFANHLKLGGLGSIVDHLKKIYTDQNYLSGAREVAQLKQELGKLGVKVDYNESFPTDYTLQIPGQSRPYTFNIIQLLKDAMNSYKTKAVK